MVPAANPEHRNLEHSRKLALYESPVFTIGCMTEDFESQATVLSFATLIVSGPGRVRSWFPAVVRAVTFIGQERPRLRKRRQVDGEAEGASLTHRDIDRDVAPSLKEGRLGCLNLPGATTR
jgi:hypothetical protein